MTDSINKCKSVVAIALLFIVIGIGAEPQIDVTTVAPTETTTAIVPVETTSSKVTDVTPVITTTTKEPSTSSVKSTTAAVLSTRKSQSSASTTKKSNAVAENSTSPSEMPSTTTLPKTTPATTEKPEEEMSSTKKIIMFIVVGTYGVVAIFGGGILTYYCWREDPEPETPKADVENNAVEQSSATSGAQVNSQLESEKPQLESEKPPLESDKQLSSGAAVDSNRPPSPSPSNN